MSGQSSNSRSSASKRFLRTKNKDGSARSVPITKLIPNFVTLIGLVVGVSSIRLALDSKWELSVYCIIAAAIIDGIDGRIARMLNASTPFGAELDSLCDMINFGLCPAIIIYLWSFQQYEFRVISWAANLLFIVCMAIRLARFNTTINDESNILAKHFFTGVNAPCGALLALLPMIIDFSVSKLVHFTFRDHTLLINFYILFVALLLPSKLSTLSSKNFSISPKFLYLSMMVAAIVIVFTFIYTWYALTLLGVLYLLSIPYTEYLSRKMLQDQKLQIQPSQK